MANTPNIRFKGFTDDWEQHELCDIYGKIRNAFVGTASPYYVENGHFYLESNNVKDGHINHNNEVFINDEFYEKQRDNWLHTGDIVMVQSGHVGHSAVIPEELNNTAAHALIIISNPQTEIDPYFLNAEFQTPLKKKNIDIITKGNTIKHILASDMKEFEVSLPNIREQRDISAFFRILDKILIIHQRRLEDLKNFKKVMLQKMFPSDGESIPEIRFFGFSDAWEQRKLGEVAQITMGQSPDGSTYSDTPSDYILVQGNADLKDGWVSPRIWTTQKTKTAAAGDLIMSVRAPAGAMGKTAYDVVLGRGVAGIKGNEFIYQTLVKMDSNGYWNRLAAGSTFESVNSDAVNNAEIMIPQDMAEQDRIGDYFKQLDSLITLHQHKYENLLKMKKYLLQQMFC
jgi:type I restriction enzyme S subunit